MNVVVHKKYYIVVRGTCALDVWWIMRRIGYHDKKKTGLIKKIKKSPKGAQSLGLVKFQVPIPPRVNNQMQVVVSSLDLCTFFPYICSFAIVPFQNIMNIWWWWVCIQYGMRNKPDLFSFTLFVCEIFITVMSHLTWLYKYQSKGFVASAIVFYA